MLASSSQRHTNAETNGFDHRRTTASTGSTCSIARVARGVGLLRAAPTRSRRAVSLTRRLVRRAGSFAPARSPRRLVRAAPTNTRGARRRLGDAPGPQVDARVRELPERAGRPRARRPRGQRAPDARASLRGAARVAPPDAAGPRTNEPPPHRRRGASLESRGAQVPGLQVRRARAAVRGSDFARQPRTGQLRRASLL